MYGRAGTRSLELAAPPSAPAAEEGASSPSLRAVVSVAVSVSVRVSVSVSVMRRESAMASSTSLRAVVVARRVVACQQRLRAASRGPAYIRSDMLYGTRYST